MSLTIESFRFIRSKIPMYNRLIHENNVPGLRVLLDETTMEWNDRFGNPTGDADTLREMILNYLAAEYKIFLFSYMRDAKNREKDSGARSIGLTEDRQAILEWRHIGPEWDEPGGWGGVEDREALAEWFAPNLDWGLEAAPDDTNNLDEGNGVPAREGWGSHPA